MDDTESARRPVLDDISIVIPTLGRDILRECLSRIKLGSYWPSKLIVVDQGRREEVAEWLTALADEGLDTQYLPSWRRGRASGINDGLRLVETRFVGIMDDDCFVDSSWLEVLVGALRLRADAVVSGKVLAGGETVVLSAQSNDRAEFRRPRLNFDRLSGGNMGTSLDVFRKAGLFDESEFLKTAEDGEWIYRVLRAGFSLIYEPALVVTHVEWRDRHGRREQYRSYARSHGGFYGKHLRKGDWFIVLRASLHFVRAARTMMRGILSRNGDLRAMGWSYLTGLPIGILSGFRRLEDEYLPSAPS